jgi:hypothetical protein
MLATIRKAWGWSGLEPSELIAINSFGHLIIRDIDGHYWRIIPEEADCRVIAETQHEYNELLKQDEFLIDWEMEAVTDIAQDKFGPTGAGRCYCLKMPAVLGGEYAAENIATVSVDELIAFAGDLARQIKDIPDGAEIELKFTE